MVRSTSSILGIWKKAHIVSGVGGARDLRRRLPQSHILAQDPQAFDTPEKVQHLVRILEPLVGRSVELEPTDSEKEHLARDKIGTIEGSGEAPSLSSTGTTPQKSQPLKIGLVISAPYLCCIFNCWLTKPPNAAFGRRGAIKFACIFCALSPLLQAFSQSWEVLFALRFLMDLDNGPESATIPIYSAECAPENFRGGLLMMWQVFTAFDPMLGCLAGAALGGIIPNGTKACPSTSTRELLANGCSLNWGLILGSPIVAPIVLAIYIYTQPESPRWQIAKGHKHKLKRRKKEARTRYKSAWNALIKLRHEDVQAARDMFLKF
jgi:MFS family permease